MNRGDDLFALLPAEIVAHYSEGVERERLLHRSGLLELARTQVLLRRYLPQPPARILDIGGGPGKYAAWLAREGFQVRLLDALPLHVEQARDASGAQPEVPFAAALGDARALDEPDQSADAVLLLGPLYHLIERADRLQALVEAHRVLRPGGVMCAAAVSRFASLLDGLRKQYVSDPAFVEIVECDLREGQHRNPENRIDWFTTAFFHHPDELAAEVLEAGFSLDGVYAVEGPGWLLPDLDEWMADTRRREQLLGLIAAVEREPSLMGMSWHFLAIGKR